MIYPNSLLLFSIGPVQRFIAAGRKTKDLFGGSLLLSYLSEVAMKAVSSYAVNGKTLGTDAIQFPLLGDNLEDVNEAAYPNRFLAKVPSSEAIKIAKSAEAAVRETLARLSAQIRNIGDLKRWKVNETVWEKQINSFLECYWVTLEADMGQYAGAYCQAEELIGQRKLLRDFLPLSETGTKCFLIPTLSMVVGNPKLEKLSAVALLKRFFPKGMGINDQFPSTSTVAVSHFVLQVLERTELHSAAMAFSDSIGALFESCQEENGLDKHNQYVSEPLPKVKAEANASKLADFAKIDGDWFFPDSYRSDYVKKVCEFERDDWKFPEENAKRAMSALSNLIDEASKSDIRPPSKYYAVFYFDGDHMGKWLSGKFGNTVDEKTHRRISKSLLDFSNKVRPIIEKEHLGKVVYSGGDDVLAFVTLQDSLDVLKKVRDSYSLEGVQGEDGEKPTGSAGMAIAHHLQDLRDVLQSARDAEHFAKESLHRDAFGVALLKRSGDHTMSGSKWTTEVAGDIIGILQEYSELIDRKVISSGFVYDVLEESPVLEELPEAMEWEFKRILRRRTSAQDEFAESVNKFEETVDAFIKSFVDSAGWKGENISPMMQALNLLSAAQFIGKGGNQ